jgi:hypothetical protein
MVVRGPHELREYPYVSPNNVLTVSSSLKRWRILWENFTNKDSAS